MSKKNGFFAAPNLDDEESTVKPKIETELTILLSWDFLLVTSVRTCPGI